MTGPAAGGPPRPVLPLEYGGRTTDGVWPLVRFLLAFVAVQGATVAAASGWTVARLVVVGSGTPRPNNPSDPVALAVELVKAAVGLGLALGGVLARGRRPGARHLCVGLELALAVLFLAETAVWVWQLDSAVYNPMETLMWGGDYAWSTVAELALPAMVGAVLRRADVRAAFTG